MAFRHVDSRQFAVKEKCEEEMTLAKSRENFLHVLRDEANKVIALSGKWGTGKTHLWKSLQKSPEGEQVTNALYISLFGLRSIHDLRLRIVPELLPSDNGSSGRINAVIKAAKKGFHDYYNAARALLPAAPTGEQIAFLLARKWLRERLIVIDDIERKHENLSIDEILGFIDDAVQNLDCRVLLILNSDQLKDSDIWETFRERVIDQEIQLATTPDDAFTIASKLEPSPYEEPLRLAVDAMQLNNIRIIRKIIRAVTRLLQGREALSAAVLDRVVPSTALLSAIYYKGLGDGPDFDFVLSYGGPYEPAFAEAARRLDHPEEPLQDDPEAANRERWELLMSKLGIHSADEFELLVIHYLRSGLMDAAAVAKIVDRYVAEECKIEAGNRLHQFFEDSYWRPDFTRSQMLERARLLMQDVPLFSPRQVTQLHDHARDILGAPDQANEIIAAWVTAFEERNANAEQRGDDSDPNPFGDELHPEIVRAIQEASARSQAPMTLLRVCRRIRERNGWGAREQALMRSVTAADYEAAIRSVTGDDLKLLLLQSMEIHKKPAVYQADFQSAADSFVQACRTIVAAEPDSRFGKLIKVVFRRADRIQDLQLPAEPAPLLPDRGEIQM